MKYNRPLIAAGTILLSLVLAACGPDAPSPSAAAKPTAPASTAPAPAPVASSPAPAPTAAAPTAPGTVHPTTPKPKPAPTHGTAAPTAAAPVAPPAAAGSCSIRSNAGNCYQAGQFCRDADLGKSTTDAADRAITCGMESGKPHWHY